jgi:hypothetical protein
MPTRPIDQVLADHDDELMAIDGVQAVYQGALDDGTPCLKVIVRDDHPEAADRIPDILEGYRVIVEMSDEIRPLGDGDR